jgi:hypothetical protein
MNEANKIVRSLLLLPALFAGPEPHKPGTWSQVPSVIYGTYIRYEAGHVLFGPSSSGNYGRRTLLLLNLSEYQHDEIIYNMGVTRHVYWLSFTQKVCKITDDTGQI